MVYILVTGINEDKLVKKKPAGFEIDKVHYAHVYPSAFISLAEKNTKCLNLVNELYIYFFRLNLLFFRISYLS